MNYLLILGFLMAICALWGLVQIVIARQRGDEGESLCDVCGSCDRSNPTTRRLTGPSRAIGDGCRSLDERQAGDDEQEGETEGRGEAPVTQG